MSKLKKSLTKYLNDKLSHNECYSEVVEKANLQKKYKENVFYMKKSFLKIALPCILGLCLIVGVVLGITLSKKNVEKSEPTAVVQMDVNPSVSFVVDNNGKVVSIYGENDEGKMILTGETFTGLKLEVAIDELMGLKEDKPFEKFMLEFLKCDLNVGNVMSELHRYIQKETSEGILKLIFMKLLFYYRMRFFGTNTQIYNSILDLIIEVQIKLKPEKSSTLSKAFKGNKSIVRKEVAKQIEKSQSIEL